MPRTVWAGRHVSISFPFSDNVELIRGASYVCRTRSDDVRRLAECELSDCRQRIRALFFPSGNGDSDSIGHGKPMDNLFDDISRILATPMPRRKALRHLGSMLAGAVLAAAAGQRVSAAAQQNPPGCDAKSCTAPKSCCGNTKTGVCCNPNHCCASRGQTAACCSPGSCVCGNGTCAASTTDGCPAGCKICNQ
jgi:hypothetical protein